MGWTVANKTTYMTKRTLLSASQIVQVNAHDVFVLGGT